MIARPAFRPLDELRRCGELLAKYWVLALPPAVASLAISLIVFAILITIFGAMLAGALAGGAHPGAGAGAGFGVGSLFGLGGIVVGFAALNVAQAVVIHASVDVLDDRPPRLGASFAAVLPRLGDLSVSMAVSLLILLVPLALSIVLIGIPLLLIAIFLLIYVQAAVVLGGENGVAAIGASMRVARAHVGETFVLALGVVAVSLLGIVANAFVVHVPILNLIGGFAIGGITSAFSAMATARFYLVLRDAPPAGSAYAAVPDAPPPASVPYGGPTLLR